MQKTRFALIALSILSLTQIGMHQTGAQHLILSLELSDYPAQMKQLQEMDMDVAGVDFNAKIADVIATPAEEQKLRDLGFKIGERKMRVGMAGPDSQYQNPAKIENLLKNYAAAYPQIAQVFSAGKSLEGRDIWVIKITGKVAQRQVKPRIFFNGMHHAREVMSVEVPLDTIETLLTQYGKEPKVTHWVDHNEIYILPMFNVDGNNKVWNAENMWRKNTRNGYGVDINRNYPYAWNTCSGSSGSTGAQDYRGPSAASEPETQVMMNLVKNIRPTFSISYHSYSEIVIYPYGCKGQRVPNRDTVEGLGKQIASLIKTDNGSGAYTAGTSYELLYSVDSGDIDWMYHEYQVIPYVIEVNASRQGFQPSYSTWRTSTVSRVRPAWQFLLDRMDGAAITGQLKNKGKSISNAIVHLERIAGGEKFVQDYPVQENGFFHIIVPNGQYQVTIQAPGLKAKTQSLKVKDQPVTVTSI